MVVVSHLTPAERLAALRQKMTELNLDVYLIPSDDPHLSGTLSWCVCVCRGCEGRIGQDDPLSGGFGALSGPDIVWVSDTLGSDTLFLLLLFAYLWLLVDFAGC